MISSGITDSLGSLLLFDNGPKVMDSLENGGYIILKFANDENDEVKEEKWEMEDGSFICKDKTIDNITAFEIYMNSDDCFDISVYEDNKKIINIQLM